METTTVFVAIAYCGAIFGWQLFLRDRVSTWCGRYSSLTRKLPYRSAMLVLRIPFYGVVGFVGYLMFVLLSPEEAIPIVPRADVFFLGLVLGGGLLMLGSAMANGCYVVLHRCWPAPYKSRSAKEDLRLAKDSGWIRTYTLAFNCLHPITFVLFCLISVVGEELAFRGVLLPLLVKCIGPGWGLSLSVVAFMAIQRPFMPSWLAAVIPICGAFVVGTVLGFLIIVTNDLFLCITGHVGYLVVTVLVFLVWDDPTYYERYWESKGLRGS